MPEGKMQHRSILRCNYFYVVYKIAPQSHNGAQMEFITSWNAKETKKLEQLFCYVGQRLMMMIKYYGGVHR